MELLFYPFAVLIAIPGGGLLPAPLLFFAFFRCKQRLGGFNRGLVLFSTLAWFGYGIYETRMYFWMQTVSAPIRVDLLLIAPILSALTLWSLIVLVRRRKQPTHSACSAATEVVDGD